MNATLNDVEVRVVGSLIEKQLSTPDYYPLSLNALMNACNQLSNREPVVSYDEQTIVKALGSLKEKGLARMITGADSRVPKYQHVIEEFFDLAVQEVAIMCVLMLRGHQTSGEIRGRTNRLYNFANLEEVDLTLQGLIDRQPQPLVMRLPRQPGTKEARYAHLLAGEVIVETKERAVPIITAATPSNSAENERIVQLEIEVAQLRQELNELQEQFREFKKQFE